MDHNHVSLLGLILYHRYISGYCGRGRRGAKVGGQGIFMNISSQLPVNLQLFQNKNVKKKREREKGMSKMILT